MAEKYDLIFNLGTLPIVSQMMHRLQLQIFDFPFDFVSGSDFLRRMSLFLLDCHDFIEQKNISEQRNYPKEGMTTYTDLKTGFVYKYDFNPDILVENNFPMVRLKYERYSKNLRLCLNGAKRILIIYVEDPQVPENEDDNVALIIEATQKLKIKYPRKEFQILYVRNDDDLDDFKIIRINDNAEKMSFNFYRKFSEASAPTLNIDMLSTIFTDIELKKNWKMKKMFFYQKMLYNLEDLKRGLR